MSHNTKHLRRSSPATPRLLVARLRGRAGHQICNFMKTPNDYTIGDMIRDIIGGLFLAALAIIIFILA